MRPQTSRASSPNPTANLVGSRKAGPQTPRSDSRRLSFARPFPLRSAAQPRRAHGRARATPINQGGGRRAACRRVPAAGRARGGRPECRAVRRPAHGERAQETRRGVSARRKRGEGCAAGWHSSGSLTGSFDRLLTGGFGGKLRAVLTQPIFFRLQAGFKFRNGFVRRLGFELWSGQGEIGLTL